MGVVALMDGDAYAFKSAIAVEKETYWGDGLWTLHSYLDDAQAVFNQMLYEIRESYEAETGKTIDKMIFCFTDANNFRKELNPDYKGNRAKVRKPIVYKELVAWIKEQHHCESWENLEADDVLGILATKNDGLDKVIISVDKDFNTIPCSFFDTARGELVHNSEYTAFKNLMVQTLAGDITDGYKGAKGVGKISANKLLDGLDGKDMWAEVLKKFDSEEEALMNFRMAYILRDGYYDNDTSTVKIIGQPNELLV